MNNLCLKIFGRTDYRIRANGDSKIKVAKDAILPSLVNLQLLQDLGDFFIDQCNVADEVAPAYSYCVLIILITLAKSCNISLQRASLFN